MGVQRDHFERSTSPRSEANRGRRSPGRGVTVAIFLTLVATWAVAPVAEAGAAVQAVHTTPGRHAVLSPRQRRQTASAPFGRGHLDVCGRVVLGRASCDAQLATSGTGTPLASAGPSYGYYPADLQSAYQTTSASASAGVGQTVAVVDAYDDPTAEADLNTYRTQFGLPPCSVANGCFRKVNQSGTSTFSTNTSWSQEISIDLDMVSAMCPNCHILLVEAASSSIKDLGTAVDEAATLGATAISNSYGASEFSGETSYDGYYDHPGVAITVSTGDNGYGTTYPAASQYVTAVGGTSLSRAPGTSRGWAETAWSGASSGCSLYVPKPSWQSDAGCSMRTIGDTSAVADPNTGVAVYDSTPDSNNVSGWLVFGGTSVAAPIIASIYALAGNTASINNASHLYGHTSSLNDVTSGSTGKCSTSYLCNAGPGYDGPTGLGTPNGLVAFGATLPTVSFDANGGNGTMSPESGSAPTPLTTNTFTYPGHVFTGWNTAANGLGTPYADGASYLFASSTTLYAQWNQSAVTASLTGLGTVQSNGSMGLTTDVVPLAHPGDLLVIWVKDRFQPRTLNQPILTSITPTVSGLIGTPHKAIQYYTIGHPNNDDEIWYVPVTSPVSTSVTLNFSWTGSLPTDYLEYSVQEFQPPTSSTYSLDATGSLEVPMNNSGSIQFPTLTPTCAGELYVGYNSNYATIPYTASTTGYSVTASSDNDAIISNPNVSASVQSPTASASNTAAQSSIGALIGSSSSLQCTVSFDANGGSGSMSPETNNTSAALTTNSFTNSGYTFTGWNTQPDGSGSAYVDGSTYPFTADVTLYAQWTQNPSTVTFSANAASATGSMAGETKAAPSPLTSNAFTNLGYSFLGWNTKADGSGTAYADGATYSFLANVTLYAQWKANLPYTVTFNANGGTGSVASETSNIPKALTSNAFTNLGYSFLGWNTKADGSGTAYADGATYSFLANVTLYAQWKANLPYTVTFNANGGTGSLASETSNIPAALTLVTAGSISRPGYSFTTWNTEKDGSGSTFTNGETFPFTASLTLYAQWKALSPHAIRVIGTIAAGETQNVTIVGTAFIGTSKVASSAAGTTVRVLHVTNNRVVVRVVVKWWTRRGTHTLRIVLRNGKSCTIRYLSR